MTELQTHSLILTFDSLAEYTKLEADRIASSNDRPMGLRMSTDCPIRRVLEFADTRYRTPIHPGIAARGHEMENRFRACCPELIGQWQIPVSWNGNTTALDFITPDGIIGELKSTTKNAGPSTANKRQVARMVEASGCDETVVHFYMLHAGMLESVGPYVYRVTDELLTDAHSERSRVIRAFNDWTADKIPDSRLNDAAYWWDVYNLACRCGACTYHGKTIEADHPLEKLMTRYEAARDAEKGAAAMKDGIRAQIEDAARTRLRVAGLAYGRIDAYWSRLRISITKSGQLRITERRDG